MQKVPDGFLRRPPGRGFVAPQVALDLLDAVERIEGPAVREAVGLEAQLFRLPSDAEPLREDKAARLHQALRAVRPQTAETLLRMAGRDTADELIRRQFSPGARSKMSSAPWPLAAWLLGRWARLHSWTFAGSAAFSVAAPMEFELRDNPLIRRETADHALCHWHAAFFEQLFRSLVDPRLVCAELTCAATGAECCRFAIYLAEDGRPAV